MKELCEMESNKDENTETVTIPKSEYMLLYEDRHLLQALQEAGVDNWDGYYFAHELLESKLKGKKEIE